MAVDMWTCERTNLGHLDFGLTTGLQLDMNLRGCATVCRALLGVIPFVVGVPGWPGVAGRGTTAKSPE